MTDAIFLFLFLDSKCFLMNLSKTKNGYWYLYLWVLTRLSATFCIFTGSFAPLNYSASSIFTHSLFLNDRDTLWVVRRLISCLSLAASSSSGFVPLAKTDEVRMESWFLINDTPNMQRTYIPRDSLLSNTCLRIGSRDRWNDFLLASESNVAGSTSRIVILYHGQARTASCPLS